jgi:hypothetical protein
LYEILKGNEEAKEQMAVHEWFERANEEDRLKYLNEVYGKFTEQIDREYFLALFRNAGVELSVESGKVNGIELLSENTRANFGHIGG